MGTLVVLSVVAYLGLKMYIENDARERIRQWAGQTGRLTDLSYQTLGVGIWDRTIQVDRVSFQVKDMDRPVTVDRLILYAFDISNDIPSFMNIEMKGIHIDRNNSFMKGMSPLLAQLGYSDIVADVAYAYRYDSLKKDMEIQNLLIRVADAGRLQASARLNNLDLALLQSVPSNPLMLISLVPAVAISGITLSFEDHSLTRRLIQWGASRSGQSEAQFIAGIAHQLNQEIQKQPSTVEKLRAIEAFIHNPGVIEMAVSPREPTPLMRLIMTENIDQLVDILNISIGYRKTVN